MIKAAHFSANHFFTAKKRLGISLSAFAALASVSTAIAQAGQLDKTFGNGGIFLGQTVIPGNTLANAVAIQSDGNILVAGSAPIPPGSLQPAVLRLTPNGVLDATFGQGGVAIPMNFRQGGGEHVTAMVIQPDGKIVLGLGFNSSDGANRLELARLESNGSLDTAFGSGGTVDVFNVGPDTAYVALQPDGRVLLGGGLLMARVNPDGSLDTGFGQKGIAPLVAPACAIALQSNGKILAVTNGNIGPPIPPANGGIVRYNANGSVDTSFGTMGRIASVVGTTAAQLQSNGQIVAVGPILSKAFVVRFPFPAVSSNTDFGVARYGSNGAIDTTFGKHGLGLTDFSNIAPFAIPTSVALESNGDILVAGQVAGQSPSSFALTRYTPTGILDTTFGTGGKVTTAFGTNNGTITAVALDRAGRLVAVGTVSTPGVVQFGLAVARYLTQ